MHFFNDDGSCTDVVVEKNLRAGDLCLLLAVKNRVTKDLSWSIVEHWIENGLGKAKYFILTTFKYVRLRQKWKKSCNEVSCTIGARSMHFASFVISRTGIGWV